MTKKPSGTHPHERMCKMEFTIPETAFKTPEYKAVISFVNDAENNPVDVEVIMDSLEASLHEFPVTVEIINPQTTNQ